jgi:hypothetical protein
MKKLVFIALLVPIAYYLYKKGKAVTSLTYKVIGAQVQSVGWNDFKLILRLNVNNESTTNLYLQKVDGVIMIDGNDTATINQIWNTNIAPGENILRLELLFNIKQALRNLWQFKPGKKIITFSGNLKLDNITLPVKYDYVYGR